MDYQKIYESIIARGKNRVLIGEYTESHHIIPRCIGGSDNLDNLVDLTPEEHYICHLLLVKMHPRNIGLVRAVMFLTSRPGENAKRNNKMYGWIKRQYSEYMKGPNNPTKVNGPWNKGIAGYKNNVNFSEDSLKEFSERMKNKNPCHGIKPWNHPRATDYSKSVWKQADNIYQVWVKNNKPSYCKIYTLVNDKCYTNETTSVGPYMNMVKYFRSGWVPENDQEWREFKNE
jgi:hypothetical protein